MHSSYFQVFHKFWCFDVTNIFSSWTWGFFWWLQGTTVRVSQETNVWLKLSELIIPIAWLKHISSRYLAKFQKKKDGQNVFVHPPGGSAYCIHQGSKEPVRSKPCFQSTSKHCVRSCWPQKVVLNIRYIGNTITSTAFLPSKPCKVSFLDAKNKVDPSSWKKCTPPNSDN